MKRLRMILALGLAAWPLTALAGLVFEQETISPAVEPGMTSVEAYYSFKNAGIAPVRITEVNSNCGCTAVKWPRDPIAPGATGEIVIELAFEGRTGPLRKQVRIWTDEEEQPPIDLTISVDIPENFSLEPRLLMWRRNQAPSAKSVTVQIASNETMTVDEPQLEGNFTTTWTELSPGLWRLTVTPASALDELATHRLELTARILDPVTKETQATLTKPLFLLVR